MRAGLVAVIVAFCVVAAGARAQPSAAEAEIQARQGSMAEKAAKGEAIPDGPLVHPTPPYQPPIISSDNILRAAEREAAIAGKRGPLRQVQVGMDVGDWYAVGWGVGTLIAWLVGAAVVVAVLNAIFGKKGKATA